MNELKDVQGISGFVRLRCEKDGKLLWDTGWVKNIITNAGKAELANLCGYGLSGVAFRYFAVGTSSTAVDATQTALVAEVTTGGLARAAATVTRTTTNVANDTMKFAKTWTASADHTIQEAGIFNDVSAGTMLGRKLTGTLNVPNGGQLIGEYKIVFA